MIFSVGGVTIGTTDGVEVVTPVDLVAGNSVDAQDVVNRVCFLLFPDSDDDLDNGIHIFDGVRHVADNWNQVDFTSSDLDNELTAIASDVGSIDGDATVPTATEAKNHFTGTLRCLSSGAFVGEFSGDREGRVAFFVRAADGAVEGSGFTSDRDDTFTLSSPSAVTLDGPRRFISGGTSGGAEFDGRFAGQDIDLKGVALENLVVHQQEGRLVVAIRDPDQPDAANDERILGEAA